MARQWTHVTSVLCVLIKFLGNLSLRFGQIYAIFFAEAVGVSTGAFLNAIGFAEFAGLIAGLFAPLFDVFNPRKMFCVGEVLALVGFALAYLDKTSLFGVGAAWFIFLGGGAVIASAVQAALSKADLGASLAFVTSTIESSWSFAGLLGIPMVGVILKQGSWELLFGLMFCLHAPIGTLLAWQFLGPETASDAVVAPVSATKAHAEIEMAASSASAANANASTVADETLIPVVPAGDHQSSNTAAEEPPPEHSCVNVCSASLAHFAFIFSNRRTFVTIIYSALMSYTQNLPAAATGQWLRLQHGYDAEAVGWISFVMGGGEMIGLLLVASLSARVGLERSVWTGATLMVLSQVRHIAGDAVM
jgi:MFS family permease